MSISYRIVRLKLIKLKIPGIIRSRLSFNSNCPSRAGRLTKFAGNAPKIQIFPCTSLHRLDSASMRVRPWKAGWWGPSRKGSIWSTRAQRSKWPRKTRGGKNIQGRANFGRRTPKRRRSPIHLGRRCRRDGCCLGSLRRCRGLDRKMIYY